MKRLIIRPGGVGDCILALPAMESLRATTTEVWAASANLPLIRFADSLRSIASTGLDLLGIPDRDPPPGVLDALARFDSIVSWYGARRPEFRASVAGLPFRFLDALPDRPGVHAADFYLRQVSPDSGPAIPRIACPPTDPAAFVAIHPFSGSAKKNWPLERFSELARRLDVPVRWSAGPEEPLEDAERFDSLYDLACWLRSARLYIGNDSGITHLAAAVGTPVVALFGPTDPSIWAPRGDRVSVVATTHPGEAMECIGVADVFAAV
ncbi:MAG TPA: glycosyltransferase family 9 protein [Bryobacteraceae bacterium]|nr:glycosyltransferase family 9 protein [Bryobacteraceae bacterium]